MRSHHRWLAVVVLVSFGAFAMLTASPRDDALTATVLVGR